MLPLPHVTLDPWLLRYQLRRPICCSRRVPGMHPHWPETRAARTADNGAVPPPALAMPFVTAAEWRLAVGEGRAADSLAMLGRAAAAIDSLALQRSAYAGRAELVRARALLALGDRAAARRAAERAAVALANGYGADSPQTAPARAVRDSIRP